MKTFTLFITTFGIIFLAELGDKTQLATMARSASSGGAKWIVFAAAASALVASTLVAVLFGELLTKLVPVWVIKLCASILFLVFGGFLLKEALTERGGEAVEPAAKPNAIARAVLKLAADFERSAAIDYQALAKTVDNPETRNLLLDLAAEEEEHLAIIEKAVKENQTLTLKSADSLPERDTVLHDVHADARPILQHAIEHEEATAGFYEELARITPVRALKQAFAELAAHERDHARRLTQHLDA
jgi:rubrerythrin